VAYHRQKDKWIKVQAIVQDRQILVLKEGGDLGSNSASSTTIGRGAKDKSKGRDVISLLHYDEVVEVDDDSIAKKTDHCLLLESGKSKVYFCLESKARLLLFLLLKIFYRIIFVSLFFVVSIVY